MIELIWCFEKVEKSIKVDENAIRYTVPLL